MHTPMTVGDLVALLMEYPLDLPVAYDEHSEYCLLEPQDITVGIAQPPRSDGWVHRERDDKPKLKYLFLP